MERERIPPTESDAARPVAEPRYFNRELTWLDFNARVIALAEDEELPLLERVKFLAIASRNLDHFFQVRVAGLKTQIAAEVGALSIDGRSPAEQLTAIHPLVIGQVARLDDILHKDLLPRLRDLGIRLSSWDDLAPAQQREISHMFAARIFPVLTPLSVDPSHPFPYISNLSLNLAVVVRDPDTQVHRFARIKVPPLFARWIALPDGAGFLPIDQLIAAHAQQLFPGMEIVSCNPFRVTRDADLALDETDAEDLLQAVEFGLKRRLRMNAAVRLEVTPHPCENQAGKVGIDLGLHHLATLSTGQVIDGPKPLKTALQALRRGNRQLARQVRYSANWHKTKAKLARRHARIAHIRHDALHKLTASLCQTFTEVVIEDLHVKGLVRNHKLARAVSDMGLRTFRCMLAYKAKVAGVAVTVADRWFPSSKMCRCCRVLHDTLTLKDQVFVCPACGHTEDRDLHATKNLATYPGLQGNGNACGLLSAGQGEVPPGETRQGEAGTSDSALVHTV